MSRFRHSSALLLLVTAALLLTGCPKLLIKNVVATYSSPYLLDFTFSLRDRNDNAISDPPDSFTVEAMENAQAISANETAFFLSRAANKQLKCFLVLDYTYSMASIEANGDANHDGKSDAIDTMETSAKSFLSRLTVDAQAGIFEFHREDWDPEKVAGLTTNKDFLYERIDAIWTEYVQNFPGASRCWDAVYDAIQEFGNQRADEGRYIVMLSDGSDESSEMRPKDVIEAALRNGVKIYCVGFGAELNSTELRAITEQTEGAYYAASNVDELEEQFGRIVFDLGGQYTLRWATLKRNSAPFVPSFNISQGWLSDKYVAQEYRPTEHQGNPLQGELRLPEYSVVDGAAAAFIRASYVPRWVRQFRFYVRSAYPFTVSAVPATDGGLCADWPNPAVQDDPETGGKWVTFESGNLNDISTAIPFGAFGPIVKFDFRNLPNDMVVLFDELYVDNSVYEQTGGQSFIGLNINHGNPQDALVHEDFEATLDSDRWKLNGGANAAVVEDDLNQGNACLFLHGADWSGGTASLELLQAVPLDNVRIDLWFRDISLHGGLGTDGHVTLMLYDEAGAEIGSCNQYYSANLDIEFAGEDYIASETNLYSLSNWHQLSVVYETGTKTMRALVDGEEVHSATAQGTPGRFARMKLLCAGEFFNSAQGYFDDISIYDATAPVEGEGINPILEK